MPLSCQPLLSNALGPTDKKDGYLRRTTASTELIQSRPAQQDWLVGGWQRLDIATL